MIILLITELMGISARMGRIETHSTYHSDFLNESYCNVDIGLAGVDGFIF